EVYPVEVRNFELSSGGRLERPCQRDYLVVVEVEAHDRVLRPGTRGLLLDAQRLSCGIELHHPVSLRVAHVVGKDRSTRTRRSGALELLRHAVAKEQIVAKNQSRGGAIQKIGADEKRLRQPLRPGLSRIAERDAQGLPISKQLGKPRQIVRGGDDQNIPEA